MKRILYVMGIVALLGLAGCYTSPEDQADYMRDSHQEAFEISRFSKPFHPSQIEFSAGDVDSPRRSDSAYWYQEKALEHVIHGNRCKHWQPSWQPLTGKDEQWAFYWIDKRNDEMAKPAATQNLRKAMQYDDGKTVYVHCQTYR